MLYETPKKFMQRAFGRSMTPKDTQIDGTSPLQLSAEMENLLVESNDALQSGDFDRLANLTQAVDDLENGTSHAGGDEAQKLEALEAAIEADDRDAARVIISRGIDLNQVNGEGGLTPLEAAVAVENHSTAMLNLLLENGADPNFQPVAGMAPLQLIVGYMHCNPTLEQRTQAAKILIEHGADPELKNARGLTALATATLEGTLEEMEALLMAGSDPNITFGEDVADLLQNKSLIGCVLEAPDKVDMLIDFGADPLAQPKGGQTAVELLQSEIEAAETEKVSVLKSLLGAAKAKKNKMAALAKSRELIVEACEV